MRKTQGTLLLLDFVEQEEEKPCTNTWESDQTISKNGGGTT